MEGKREVLNLTPRYKESLFFHQSNGNNYVSLGSDEGVAVPMRVWRLLKTAMHINEVAKPYGEKLVSKSAQDIFQNTNCHKAVLYLEGIIDIKDLHGDTEARGYVAPRQGDDGGYRQILDITASESMIAYKTSEELREAVIQQRVALPCVVHASIPNNRTHRGETFAHSFVMLGVDAHGRVVCADKRGYSLPFRICELSQVVQLYRNAIFYADADSAERLQTKS